MKALAGLFIGGKATRFGGIAKGMLEAPDGTGRVIERLQKLSRAVGADPVFVGPSIDPRYFSVSRLTVIDRPGGLGPLGGVLGLYDHAIDGGYDRVLAVACDMPFVAEATLARLLATAAPLAASKREGRWEPFLSVHDPRIMRARAESNVAAGKLSLQALFDDALEIEIDPHELDDWDSPEDVGRTMPMRTMSK